MGSRSCLSCSKWPEMTLFLVVTPEFNQPREAEGVSEIPKTRNRTARHSEHPAELTSLFHFPLCPSAGTHHRGDQKGCKREYIMYIRVWTWCGFQGLTCSLPASSLVRWACRSPRPARRGSHPGSRMGHRTRLEWQGVKTITNSSPCILMQPRWEVKTQGVSKHKI